MHASSPGGKSDKQDLSGRIEKTDGGEHHRGIGERLTLEQSVIAPFINPHRLRLPSPFKAVLLVELDRSRETVSAITASWMRPVR